MTATPARVHLRCDRVFVRVTAYGTGAAAPDTVSADCSTGPDSRCRPAGVRTSGRAMRPRRAASTRLRATLAPGEYVVELTTTAGPTEPRKEMIGFRITG